MIPIANLKKLTALIFSVITVVLFSSCNNTPDIEELTYIDDATCASDVTDISDDKFDKEKLFEVNSISNLLKKYKSVKIIDKHDGAENIEQYFLYDGKTVLAQKWTGENGNELYAGWIKGFYIEYDGEYHASVSPYEPTGKDAECPYDGAISNQFSEYKIELVEETADSFILSLEFEGQSSDVVHNCTVDKKTHIVKSICYATADGYTATTEYVYGEDVDDFGMTDGFDNTKTVTINFNAIKNGNEENKTVEYVVPSDWILVPSLYDDYTLYSNVEYTQLFEYPGHGQDYTIYATNSKG